MDFDGGIDYLRANLFDIHQMIFFAFFVSLRFQHKLGISLIISWGAFAFMPSLPLAILEGPADGEDDSEIVICSQLTSGRIAVVAVKD